MLLQAPALSDGIGGVGVHVVALGLLILAGAVMAVVLRARLAAVVALGLTGLGIALLFALLSAPDLAMTQIMVESLTVILLALLLIFAAGGVVRGRAPLVVAGELAPPSGAADPVPQALILTAIVIGFAVISFAAVLARRVFEVVGTDDPEAMEAEP